MRIVAISDIDVGDRQRTAMKPAEVEKLRESILRSGLIHPLLVNTNGADRLSLIAGERRLTAISAITEPYVHGSEIIQPGFVPVTEASELSEVARKELELDENLLREDLSWKDRARAIADLHGLREAERGEQSVRATAEEIAATTGRPLSSMQSEVSRSLFVAQHLNNPKVAKASSLKDAQNILSREFEAIVNNDLRSAIGDKTEHTLLEGSCIELLQTLDEAQFDCILTDPPYGMGADSFGDAHNTHHYKDDRETALDIAEVIFFHGFRLCKPQAHLYMFCDINLFHELRSLAEQSGWHTFRTPLIWTKGGGMGVDPWPQRGFRRSYECILYAERGGKPYNKFLSDVIEVPSIADPSHPAAKPVELFRRLLERSCLPGDSVLDPCAGTGTIFPAANALRVRAVGIEFDSTYAAIASARRFEGEQK